MKLFDPSVDNNEENAIKKVLHSHFWASGTGIGKVLEFEEKFRKYTKASRCISVNSGTAALHLALSLFNIKNKEVILPSLSFVSTAHAIIYNGGIPIFVDVKPDTLCIDPEMIKKSITKKTAMILPVHFAGFPCDLDEIIELRGKFNLEIIEDAAHAAGASYKNKKIGSHGNAVCFSFHPVKNLAMPSGGAITLNDKNERGFTEDLKSKRWMGISNRKGSKYDVKDIGWNYYMNEFSAAIGIEQLKKLDKTNSKRKEIACRYSKELHVEQKIPFNRNCSYHIFWITVNNRDNFIKKMQQNKIEIGIHYLPIHKMKFYNSKSKLPITEKITKNIVSLPIHPNLTDDDIDKIIKLTNKFSK
ncbi:DegT/DnrJ/EryC1/StrS family aminotransferase [Candidatus Nitrosarchaeum limnium]|uniref:DegT/DnrJ/EryC1/StrS family aminotransferase n=1 Tax=Candidatus Nitrosarchaeum limnium TaxID=1007084 RepID=UPI00064F7955|nr:DegT/DnrJ/EryC1/StrS family aminotransferase [Candidatus Nitrosarchaeum limnium]